MTSPTESFDTRLDNTLETLAEGWRSWIHSELDGTSFIKDDLDSVERVKDEAKQAIRELVLSEIGEDEYYNHHIETVSVPGRNQLRAELRARINGGITP